MNVKNVSNGDLVRVRYADGMTVEGTVTFETSDYYTLNGKFSIYHDEAFSLTVLKKAMPEEPPVGSVVKNNTGDTFVRVGTQDEGHWLWINGWHPARIGDTWKYLCEQGFTVLFWNNNG